MGFLCILNFPFLQINVYRMISSNCFPDIMFLQNVISKEIFFNDYKFSNIVLNFEGAKGDIGK